MSDFSYDVIKGIAKRHKLGINDLLAMSAGNDPFYMGSPADWRNAEWFEALYARSGREQIHLRGLHYIAVSLEIMLPTAIRQNGARTRKYLNTEESWQFLVKASSAARWLGLVDFDSIIDNKNEAASIRFRQFHQHDAPEIGFALPDLNDIQVMAYTASAADVMPYYMCLFSEKSSVSYLVDPLAERYHVDTQYFSGEFSHTAIHELVGRIESADRPAVLFVLSDFDAAGRSIAKSAARRLEYLVKQAMPDGGPAVTVQQLMLSREQVVSYGLPFTPMKASEKRADKFLDQMQVDGAVEIDAMLALHPDEFKRIIEQAFRAYSDLDKLAEAQRVAARARQAARSAMNEILERNRETIEAAQAVFDEIEGLATSMSMTPFMIERSEKAARVVAEDAVIYDSQLNYMAQIRRYKAWEQGEELANA